MKYTVNIFFCLFLFVARAQPLTGPLSVADTMPSFKGGMSALAEYIVRDFRLPSGLVASGSRSEKAYVEFIVDSSGKVTQPKIVKASSFKEFDQEAIRLVSEMPHWNPGFDKGRRVNVIMTIPVSYRFSSDPPKMSPEQEKVAEQYNKARSFEQDFNFYKALECYEECLKTDSRHRKAMIGKGNMLMVTGRKEEACAVWRQVPEGGPEKAEANSALAKYCNDNGVTEMKKHYVELRGQGFYWSGVNEMKNGRYEAALSRFDSCLAYHPVFQDGLYNKALMHHKLGQNKAACSTWAKLLEIAPQDKQTEDQLKKHCK